MNTVRARPLTNPQDSYDLIDTGTIVRSFPDQVSYDVDLDHSSATEQNCMSLVGGVFLPLLGIKMNLRLPLGTKVLVLKGAPSYIISTVPIEPPDLQSGEVGTVTGQDTNVADLGDEDAAGHNLSSRIPRDVLPGEFDLRNALGVAVSVLTYIAKLQAGDKAKVECFLLDELVRVVSNNFRHMSSFGEHTIINDNGRINVRWHGTPYEFEGNGLRKESDPLFTTNTNGVIGGSPVAETGRWRFSQYIGQLGDMVHFFLHDPVDALGQLAQQSAGKLHIHAAADGTFLMQSVADIVFERVSRIVVPVELKRPQDPTGDTAEDFLPPDPTFLDTWQFNPAKPWETAYYLRDYARWLNSYHAYARFMKMDKDWQVGSEAGSPVPDYSCGEQDRSEAVTGQARAVRLTYSCIRVLRDGSHVLLDGYGGCFMMTGGSGTISMPKDLKLEAGRNLTLVAGGSMFVKARKHLEMVAVTGELLLKARARLAAWCEQGTLLLKTCMKKGAAPDSGNNPTIHRFADPNVGLVIDAPNASALVSAGGMLAVEGLGSDLAAGEAGVRIQSLNDDVQLLTSRGKAVRIAGGDVLMNVQRLAASVVNSCSIFGTVINLGNALFVKAGQAMANNFVAQYLGGKIIVHEQEMRSGSPPHTNHVGLGSVPVNPPDTSADLQAAVSTSPAAAAYSMEQRTRPAGDYLRASEYDLEPTPQSLAQQLAASGDHPAQMNFDTWLFSTDGDQGDSLAVNKVPWPGPNAQTTVYTSNAVLHKPSSDTPDTFKPNQGSASQEAASFQYWTGDASA
jgi:hypothetical protein